MDKRWEELSVPLSGAVKKTLQDLGFNFMTPVQVIYFTLYTIPENDQEIGYVTVCSNVVGDIRRTLCHVMCSL